MELQYSMQIKAVQYAIEFINSEIKSIKDGVSDDMTDGYKNLLDNRVKSLESEKNILSKWLEDNKY